MLAVESELVGGLRSIRILGPDKEEHQKGS